MKTALIQITDCDGEACGLYAYNADTMSSSQAARLINEAFDTERSILIDAGESMLLCLGDVQDGADERLCAQGIERVYAENISLNSF